MNLAGSSPLVAVLGSSRAVEGSPDYEEALAVGREIAARGGTVVCGGYSGVMEAAARGAAERGGESIGVVLAGGGEPNRFITRRQTASDLSERLRLLRDLPGAWIFLPKGLGTLLEILWVAESITKKWVEARPMVFLGDFWRAAVETALREAAGRGAGALRGAVRWTADPAAAVEAALGPLEM